MTPGERLIKTANEASLRALRRFAQVRTAAGERISLAEARRRWPVPPKVVGPKVNVGPVNERLTKAGGESILPVMRHPSPGETINDEPMTRRDVMRTLRDLVKALDGNSAAVARALKVDRQYLQMVLAGRRPPTGEKLLKALKLRRVVTETFEPL